ncbi:hypothetical protein IJ579_04910 [bacterium]|nr:hypothetical protein [bacterium]
MLTGISNKYSTIIFTSRKEPGQDYEHFSRYAQETNFPRKIQHIISDDSNYISEGANGKVFSIPDNPNFVLKVDKKFNPANLDSFVYNIEEINEPFGDLNVGQPIAKYGEEILVLIRQKGKEFGLPFVRKHVLSKRDIQNNIHRYIKNLIKIAEIDQSGYDNFVREIKELQQRGFNIDIWNSNNVLIDGNNINIVDILKLSSLRQKFYARMSKMAILRLFIDESPLRQMLPYLKPEQKSKIGKHINIISQKISTAMKKEGLNERIFLNKFLANIRDFFPREKPRIDLIIEDLIKSSKL